MDIINETPPAEDITHWAPAGSCEQLTILRLDKVHPVVSGNKWYKLRYNVAEARAQGKTALLTFGGGYSNHLVATAFAARAHGLESIGIVRGNYAHKTPTLQACESYGMQLLPFPKAEYAARAALAAAHELGQQFPGACIIPEGGANEAGIRGAAGIGALIPGDVTDVCVAVGTGATWAGLHTALGSKVRLHGFCAARNCDAARSLIRGLSPRNPPLLYSASDARFGKWTEDLIVFIQAFYRSTGIPLDVVYTGKMMMKLREMLISGIFMKRRIMCIHTGGLQGNPAGFFA